MIIEIWTLYMYMYIWYEHSYIWLQRYGHSILCTCIFVNDMNTVLNDYRGRGGLYKWSWWRPACLGWTPVSPSSSSWPCSVLLWGDTGQEWPVPRGEYVIGVASWGVVNGPGREGENGLLIKLIHFILFMTFFSGLIQPKKLKNGNLLKKIWYFNTQCK